MLGGNEEMRGDRGAENPAPVSDILPAAARIDARWSRQIATVSPIEDNDGGRGRRGE